MRYFIKLYIFKTRYYIYLESRFLFNMPQLFQALRCYKCLVFQVHQTKKSNKWVCKLCGEKQSLKRHYGIGTAKDCRLYVQKLNVIRGDLENNSDENNTTDEEESQVVNNSRYTNNKSLKSKWSDYVDEAENSDKVISKTEETMYLNNVEVVLEPKFSVKRKKITDEFDINEYEDLDNKTPSIFSKSRDFNKETIVITNINPITNKIEKTTLNTIKNNLTKATTLINNKIAVLNETKPLFNKNSKWAQYVDEETPEPENINIEPLPRTKQKLISLFEDDITDELDI